MTSNTTTALSRDRAAQMWENLRNALLLTEESIREIVRLRAWEPLGYDSFLSAWTDLMRDVPLASQCLKAAVIYAMFDQGAGDQEVALAVHQAGPRTVREMRRNHQLNVPPSLVRVKSFERRHPSPPQTVKFALPASQYADLTTRAAEENVTLGELARALVLNYFGLDR